MDLLVVLFALPQSVPRGDLTERVAWRMTSGIAKEEDSHVLLFGHGIRETNRSINLIVTLTMFLLCILNVKEE